MNRRVGIALYVVLAVLLAGKVVTVAEGFFLSPGFLDVCVAAPLGVLSILYLFVHLGRVWVSAGRVKFWSRRTAAALLLVLWAAPFVPGYLPRLAGYYLRVKAIGDVPAILAWADAYAPPATPAASGPVSEWEDVPPQNLPDAIKALGWYASFRARDRAVMIVNGGGLVGHWGVTVGRGIADSPDGRSGWRVSDDAFVWDIE